MGADEAVAVRRLPVGEVQLVVTFMAPISNFGSASASTAATTTGKYSGRQPAITAFVASFSRVASPFFGGSTATTSFAGFPYAASIAATRSWVGGTIGSPSVQPRS